MHWIDFLIFAVYLLVMLGVGFYFMRRNKTTDDYYVGGRKMSSFHIGLSVVATDVGGGFSIGLGGLGFSMGLAGSWLLFTGLVGAWISAVILIPKVRLLSHRHRFLTFPQILKHFFDYRVALLAGIISAIAYTGFTGSQILAGAKLASATFDAISLDAAMLIMGVIAVIYTVLGGLKAVIYTDTVQWLVLMAGLILVGLPICYQAIGGYQVIMATLEPDFLKLHAIKWQTLVKWGVTIIPIWFVGMTLYQRIYAAKSPKQARRAWFIAGLFEYPIMAFTGVLLGLFARVAMENGMFSEAVLAGSGGLDAEKGLPILLKHVLPVGFLGLMMAAYFSAIMSTADSCLMAASGNIVTDILGPYLKNNQEAKKSLRLSQLFTLIIGMLALWLAYSMDNVLEMVMLSYGFMVSGLFIPVLGAFFWKRATSTAALWSMLLGGSTSIILKLLNMYLPWGLDANVFGILLAFGALVFVSLLFPEKELNKRGELSK